MQFRISSGVFGMYLSSRVQFLIDMYVWCVIIVISSQRVLPVYTDFSAKLCWCRKGFGKLKYVRLYTECIISLFRTVGILHETQLFELNLGRRRRLSNPDRCGYEFRECKQKRVTKCGSSKQRILSA